jgi:hypothetical protein
LDLLFLCEGVVGLWLDQDRSLVAGWIEISTGDLLHRQCLESRGASFRDGVILLAAAARNTDGTDDLAIFLKGIPPAKIMTLPSLEALIPKNWSPGWEFAPRSLVVMSKARAVQAFFWAISMDPSQAFAIRSKARQRR